MDHDHPNEYQAFISYSQKDRKFARRLHKALEKYKAPKGSVKNRRRNLGKIFIDNQELRAAPNVRDELNEALDKSEYLIVLASPNSAQSSWVNEEVGHFKRTNPARNVITILLDGDPDSSDPEFNPFCENLITVYDGFGKKTDEREAPLAPSVKQDSFVRVISKIAASIFDVPFDNLWQREKRRRIYKRLSWAGSISALVLIAAMGVWWTTLRLDLYDSDRQFEALLAAVLADGEGAEEGFETPDGNGWPWDRANVEDYIDVFETDDINDDGIPDFFIEIGHMAFCGTRGCQKSIYVSDGRDYKLVFADSALNNPEIQFVRKNGYRSFSAAVGVTGDRSEDSADVLGLYEFDGERYEITEYAVCGASGSGLCGTHVDDDGFTWRMQSEKFRTFTECESRALAGVHAKKSYAGFEEYGRKENPVGQFGTKVAIHKAFPIILNQSSGSSFNIAVFQPAEHIALLAECPERLSEKLVQINNPDASLYASFSMSDNEILNIGDMQKQYYLVAEKRGQRAKLVNIDATVFTNEALWANIDDLRTASPEDYTEAQIEFAKLAVSERMDRSEVFVPVQGTVEIEAGNEVTVVDQSGSEKRQIYPGLLVNARSNSPVYAPEDATILDTWRHGEGRAGIAMQTPLGVLTIEGLDALDVRIGDKVAIMERIGKTADVSQNLISMSLKVGDDYYDPRSVVF